MTSKVGIPQGGVLSPLLCNLYTGDTMDNVKSKTHSEFADDNTVVTHGQNICSADRFSQSCVVIRYANEDSLMIA